MDNDYTYYNNNRRQSHLKLIIAAIIVLLGLLVWLTIAMSGGKSGTGVTIHVLPTYAKVYMNNQLVDSNPQLKPGTYKVKASAPGFADYKGVYSVDESTSGPILAIALNPVSQEAKTYQQNHQALYAKQESYAGQEAHQQSALIFQKSPITKQLPYTSDLFKIGYQTDPSDPSGQSVVIDITAGTGFRNAAVNQLRKMGYDPTDLKINFVNHANPFTNE